MFQILESPRTTYCPDCGQPYEVSVWETNGQRCSQRGCFGSTSYGRIPLKVVEYLRMEKSDLAISCGNCKEPVIPLERYCYSCGNEVNTMAKQNSFRWYKFAKWTQKNEVFLSKIITKLIFLGLFLLCGFFVFEVYQLAWPSVAFSDSDPTPSSLLSNNNTDYQTGINEESGKENSDYLPTSGYRATSTPEIDLSTEPAITPTRTPESTSTSSPVMEATPIPTIPVISPTPFLTPVATPMMIEETDGSVSGKNQLVYASEMDGRWCIFSFDMDSRKEKLLASTETGDHSAPVWSPDGTRIAFHSQRNENWDIYIMDIAGSNIRRLTTNESLDLFPTWSPDGSQLAFHSNRNGNYDLFIITIESGDVFQLTSDPALEAAPDWSPDGTRLAFEADYGGESDIYILELETLTMWKLFESEGNEESPVWSPDGKQIAFTSRDDGDYEIFVMDVTGDNLIQLTSNTVNDLYPSWSPDGDSIVYESWQGNGIDLYVMKSNGEDKKPVIEFVNNQRYPSWLKQKD